MVPYWGILNQQFENVGKQIWIQDRKEFFNVILPYFRSRYSAVNDCLITEGIQVELECC